MLFLTAGIAYIQAMIVGSALVGQMGTATGMVVDGDGRPVAKAIVRFEIGGEKPIAFESKTDDKGKFLIVTSQVDGPWAITVRKKGHIEYSAEQFVNVPLGGISEIPTITLWVEGDERAPRRVTEEEAAEIEALRQALMALKAEVDQAVSLIGEGEAAQEAGDDALAQQKFDEAIAAYDLMIEKNPEISELYFNRGVAYKRKKQWALAAASYAKAAELKPEMAEAFSAGAVAYMNANDMTNATEILSKGIEAHSDDPKLQYLLAYISFNGGDYDKAAPLFSKVLESDPINPEPHYYLGMIAVAQNKTAECVSHLEKYIAMNPKNAQNLQAAKDVLGAVKPRK
jgi:cytochrome c-type biogenesis protein CcmH/NrfG